MKNVYALAIIFMACLMSCTKSGQILDSEHSSKVFKSAIKPLGQTEIKEIGLCWEYWTRPFTIFTNLEDEKERQILAIRAEELYDGLMEFLKPYMTPDQLDRELPQITLYYFRTSVEMVRFCHRKGIDPPGNGKYGLAMGLESYNAKEIDLAFFGEVGPHILHEGLHLLDFSFIRAPKPKKNWILEGFACYFQSLERKNGKYILGRRKDFWELMGPTQYIQLEKFCNLTPDEWWGMNLKNDNLNLTYCEASALVRFFIHAEGGKYKDKFIKEAIVGGKCSSEELARIFGLNSLNDIEDEFIKYANTLYKQKISK